MDLDVDEEDVDVIFEDSVLHKALKDCSFEAIETESKPMMTEQEEPRINASGDQNGDNTSKAELHHPQPRLFTWLAQSPFFIRQSWQYQRWQTLQRLSGSRLLLQDDKEFLQNFMEDCKPLSPPDYQKSGNVAPVMVLMLAIPMVQFSSWPGAFFESLIKYLEQIHGADLVNEYNGVLERVLMAMVFLMIFSGLFVLYRLGRMQLMDQIQDRDSRLHRLEDEAWELVHLEKRCIRLLRESELVARGFTLATQQHHLNSANQKQGHPSTVDRLCPSLRQTLLRKNSVLLAEIRAAVVKMMERLSLRVPEADLCPPGDFLPSAQDLEEDVVPLAPLTKSVTLVQVYISGCVRRLALCFYENNPQDTLEPTIDPFTVTQECVERCTLAITDAHKVLREQFAFYRAFHQSLSEKRVDAAGNDGVTDRNDSEHRRAGTSPPASAMEQVQNFYNGVNSLDLHLQSVLITTRDLASNLEMLLDQDARERGSTDPGTSDTDQSQHGKGSSPAVEGEDWTAWETALKTIKTGLDSVSFCYDESLKQLERHRGSQSQERDENASVPAASSTPWSERAEEEHAKVKVVPAEDPIIEDQVFEAEADKLGLDEDEAEMAEWRRQRQQNKENRARIQEQRETMKRLRQELGAVVAHRAVIQREREEKALAKARGDIQGEKKEGKTGEETIIDTEDSKENDASMSSQRDSEGKLMEEQQRNSDIPEENKISVSKDGISHETIPAIKMDLSKEESPKRAQSSCVCEEKALFQCGNNSTKCSCAVDEVESSHPTQVYHAQKQSSTLKVGNDSKEAMEVKESLLGSVCEGLAADLNADLDDMKQLGQTELVPGVFLEDLKSYLSAETKSLGPWGEESCYEGREWQDRSGEYFSALDDTRSDSFAVVKQVWKRPAPPRVVRTGHGAHYVVPVNLITVGMVLQGATGGGAEGGGGDGAGDREDKGKKGDGRDDGKDKGGEADEHGGGRRRSSSTKKDWPGKERPRSARRRHTVSGPYRDKVAAPEQVHGGDRQMRDRRYVKEDNQQLELRFDPQYWTQRSARHTAHPGSADRTDAATACKSLMPFLSDELGGASYNPAECEDTSMYDSPQLLPPGRGLVDDGQPDPDLVGGHRFSPDFDAYGFPYVARESRRDDGQQDVDVRARLAAAMRARGRASNSASSQINVPTSVDPEAEGFRQVQGRYVSRHNFTASESVMREHLPHRRPSRERLEQRELGLCEALDPQVLCEGRDYLTGERSHLLMSDSAVPPPSPFYYRTLSGASPLLDEDPDSDQWVKITLHKMISGNGSRVEVLREKDINLHNVLAGMRDPVPSPDKDSSFTRSLAKLAAAQAHRRLRSDDIGISGQVETFGDVSSSEEEQDLA